MRFLMRFAATLFMLFPICAVLNGCSSSSDDFEGARPVLPYLQKAAATGDSFGFEVGAYQNGWAVIGDNGEAFWTKDGKPYYVNEAAKAIAPELEEAPENVKFDDAFQAAAKAE